MKTFLISSVLSKAVGMSKAGLCILALGTGASIYGTTALYRIATHPATTATAPVEAASTKVTSTRYSAGTREGLIGVTEEVPVDNPADNVFHVKVKETLSSTDKVYLVYELSGVEDHSSVSRSVNDQLSVGGYLVKKRTGWAKQRELLKAEWLRQGDNVVRFTLPAGASHSYRVRNLSLQVEKATAGVAGQDLIINQPLSHAYYQDQAYLKGFAQGAGSEKAQITVDGKKVSVFKGEFEALIARPKGAQQWTAVVEALYPNGQKMRKEVSFSFPSTAHYRYGYQKAGQTTQKLFSATQSNSISLTGAGLSAAKGDLAKQSLISITALREVDIPALDAGMVNVTRHSSGFRFLPHRTRFAKAVSLKLAYDESKIPEGYTEKDIKTYFFDEDSHHWVALPTDTVLAETMEVFSRTTHFTDMINAIIKVPESPEVSAYNSTSIKGIKAANPTAGVNLINAPSANNTGNASLGYPLNLPAGRKGMQPQVAISYNSGGGNSWLGLGWNVQMSAVSIDTRWGVPRYDTSKETETYSLNGEQLSPVAHRGELKERSAEKRFYPRVEGSFSKIIRHGDSPKNYWWEVTDKSGTRYSYGGVGTKLDENAVLRTDEVNNGGNVAYWALVETRDLDGNFVRYHYTKQEDVGIKDGSVKGYQLYIDRITYTGHGTSEGLYSVVFTRDRKPESQWTDRRKDVTIQANLGFKQVTADRLKKVEVQFNGQNIRHYELHYREGEFHKTLLSSITEHDVKGQLFTTHTFDYYNDLKAGQAYSHYKKSQDWKTGTDGVEGDFVNKTIDGFTAEATALSGTKSKDLTVGMTVSVGPTGDLSSKLNSVGGSFSFTKSSSEGLLSMIDLNGDGLPDKLFVRKKPGSNEQELYYRPNLSGSVTGDLFGTELKVEGIDLFHKEKSKTVNFGVEANALGGLMAGANNSRTTSTTSVYFTEANGDGLPDIVKDGKVYFNHVDPKTNKVYYTLSSDDTPSIVLAGKPVTGDLLDREAQQRELAEAAEQNPLQDVVRMWRAPYSGTVAVKGTVQLLESNDKERADAPADGVRVAVQLRDEEKWSLLIEPTDYSVHTPHNVSRLSVSKGDRIYFRAGSRDNGSYDSLLWNPVVEYLHQDLELKDANGKALYRFSAGEDFVLSSPQTVTPPLNGTVTIGGTLVKPVTSDDITVMILRTAGQNPAQVVWQKQYAWNEAVNTEITLPGITVRNDEKYNFKVMARTNVNWPAIKWKPYLVYTAAEDPEVDVTKVPIEAHAVPEFSLFAHVLEKSTPWKANLGSETEDELTVKPLLEFRPLLLGQSYRGEVTFSVKKPGALLAKKTLTVEDGRVTTADPALTVRVQKEEELYVEYHFAGGSLTGKITRYDAQVTGKDTKVTLRAGLHTTLPGNDKHEDVIFGPLYRGWGHFAWNGNGDWATQPIDQDLLKVSDKAEKQKDKDVDASMKGDELDKQDTFDPSTERFVILGASGKHQRWQGYDNEVYLAASLMSCSRQGEDDLSGVKVNTGSGIDTGSGTGVTGTGAPGIDKISKVNTYAYTLGASVGGIGGSASFSSGHSRVVTDFMDMNGDRYPDVVSEKIIQYSSATGGLSDRTSASGGESQKTYSETEGASLSGSTSIPAPKFHSSAKSARQVSTDAGDAKSTAGSAKFSANGSISVVTGTNYAEYSFVDINGDGLPDRVNRQRHTVALNLGYGFAGEEPWNFDQIQDGGSATTTGGAGLGFTKGNNSISAGFSLARSDNFSKEALQDVNGDGLVDILQTGTDGTLWVRLNTGNGFATAIPWEGVSQISANATASESANLAFTFGITIGPVRLVFNPSISKGHGMSREKARFSDVNGDGFPDFVSSDKDDKLSVSLSTIGRTNLLKSVQRPLGASFVVNYERKGNTYQMPHPVWTLSRVVMYDGFKNDGPDSLLTTFAYENGYYDRHEREFYGFGKVITSSHDTEKKQDNLYRSVVQTLSNDSYFTKGLVLTETLLDKDGKKYTEKENTYELKEIIAGEVFFPSLSQTEQRFYEGQSEAGKRIRMRFGYNSYGNITSLVDEGDLSSNDDDLSAQVSYHEVERKYIMATPKSIVVSGGGKTMRRRESVLDENTGNVTGIKQYLEDEKVALHEMEYDPYGNLVKVIRPANAKGERLSIEYVYDQTVHSYVTKSSNSFGYSSEASYDYSFGQLLQSKDLNGQGMQYQLDDLGRVVKIRGPYEIASGADFTIKFSYHPEAAVPYALTHHFDPAHPDNPLITSTFVDGLGRVLQTKKDIALYSGEGAVDKEGMVVSGRVLFDGLGRTVKAYYPVSEQAGKESQLNPAFDGIAPTVSVFDVLDRTLRVMLPDGAATLTEYGFASDRSGQQQFSVKTTDANGKISEQFTDGRDRVTSVKNYTSEGDVWTSFSYNALGEQIESIDDKGHKTISSYDWLGRRITRVHPDAGLSTYAYDLAGNLTSLQTANLAKSSEFITYSYQYERLTDVTYPQNPENNVHYSYGEAGASENRAGRVVLQEDASGAQEFFYGPLGEVVKNTRTVVIPQHGAQTYTTEWQYDTWNRITSMTYADGEKVSYVYNAGGLLHSMSGEKGGRTYNYVQQLGYDKFEQRVFLHYGNGTKTTYSYEDDRRRLKNMTASTSAERAFMANEYSYDKVNNILSLKNSAPVPSPNLMGGSSQYSYEYDDLYRLTEAKGHYKGPNEQHRYTLQMRYNSVGSILEKTQLHQRTSSGSNWQDQKKTTYQQAYTYSQEQPHAAIHIGGQTYSYDSNGNQTGWTNDKSGQRRKIFWDEENRIRAIMDNGATYHYVYDAQGDRVLKGHSSGQNLFVNASQKAGSGNMSNYTVYVNPYIVLRSGGYTKHYYIESQRIVSKLGSGWDNSGKGPLETNKAGEDKVNYENKHQQLSDAIVKNLKFLGQDGAILTAGKSGKVPPGQLNTKGKGGDGGSEPSTSTVESFQYYYHPDHLGSTSYITDASGEVYQHLEYFAFGETFVEEHSNTNRTPYLFNGKELDDETGLYYYGARYYDARTSIFVSVDPLADYFSSLTPYQFAGNRVPNAIDLDGLEPVTPQGFIPINLVINPAPPPPPTGWHPPMKRDFTTTKTTVTPTQATTITTVVLTGQSTQTVVNRQYDVPNGKNIPSTIETKDKNGNGVSVSVSFLNTPSDKKSSDNKISIAAVDGFIATIQKANEMGADIKSLAVSATTNGDHKGGWLKGSSNHYKGNAIDIGLVNGVRPSPADSLLQMAADSIPYINENFGPSFDHRKTKTTSDQNHSSWIHISF